MEQITILIASLFVLISVGISVFCMVLLNRFYEAQIVRMNDFYSNEVSQLRLITTRMTRLVQDNQDKIACKDFTAYMSLRGSPSPLEEPQAFNEPQPDPRTNGVEGEVYIDPNEPLFSPMNQV